MLKRHENAQLELLVDQVTTEQYMSISSLSRLLGNSVDYLTQYCEVRCYPFSKIAHPHGGYERAYEETYVMKLIEQLEPDLAEDLDYLQFGLRWYIEQATLGAVRNINLYSTNTPLPWSYS